MNDVTGMPQTAVVLGGGSEIARAVLAGLARHRLRRVVLTGPTATTLEAAAAALAAAGVESEVVVHDLTDVASIEPLVRRATDRLGTIDLVLVAAGQLGTARLGDLDASSVAALAAANFSGPAAALVAFGKALAAQGGGRLVVLSSAAGYRVRKANFVYGAAKAGLDGLAQGLRDALEGTGVEVTIVRPGFVRSRMTAGMAPAPLSSDPEDVAAAVVAGIQRRAEVVWVPSTLGPLLFVLRLLPSSLWRRLPG